MYRFHIILVYLLVCVFLFTSIARSSNTMYRLSLLMMLNGIGNSSTRPLDGAITMQEKAARSSWDKMRQRQHQGKSEKQRDREKQTEVAEAERKSIEEYERKHFLF